MADPNRQLILRAADACHDLLNPALPEHERVAQLGKLLGIVGPLGHAIGNLAGIPVPVMDHACVEPATAAAYLLAWAEAQEVPA